MLWDVFFPACVVFPFYLFAKKIEAVFWGGWAGFFLGSIAPLVTNCGEINNALYEMPNNGRFVFPPTTGF